jgi:hypothetical protein
MDIICPRCTEPWDNDCLHEEADERTALQVPGNTYHAVMREFQSKGCEAFKYAYGQGKCAPVNNTRSAVASAMYDLLGDDMDGAASMMEDFEYLGLLD